MNYFAKSLSENMSVYALYRVKVYKTGVMRLFDYFEDITQNLIIL